MLKRSVSSGGPAVTVVEIDDPTRAGEGVEIFDLDVVQLASAPSGRGGWSSVSTAGS